MSESASSTGEKGAATHTEYAGKNKAPFFVKPGANFWRRERQSLKRWWWVHVIILILVALAVTPPVIYVGYPHLAQSSTDATDITVEGIRLSSPTPNSYRLSLNSTQHPSSTFTPTLDAFNVSFYLTDHNNATPFQVATFPRTHVQKPTMVNITKQLMTINEQNREAWHQYLRVAVASSTYRVTNIGTTRMHLGSLPSTRINFKKHITLRGLDGLKGITTTNISVDMTSEVDNFRALVKIPNPSVNTIELENVTFAAYIAPNGTFIGNATLRNVTIYPGPGSVNSFPLVASVKQQPVVAALGVRPYCETGNVTLTLVPEKVDFEGSSIGWLLQSLGNVTQSLPVGEAIGRATGGLVSYYCPEGV